MTEMLARPWGNSRRQSFISELTADRVTLALSVVFVLAAIFYLWTAGSSFPLSLDLAGSDRYNLLADAFLHFHLSIGPPPAGLLHVTNPYDPALNAPFVHGKNDATTYVDDILYHGRLYLLWGPAPAIVWLVPMHLLGFEPSSSLTCSVFAIGGLGFALGTLRILLRSLGERAIWMSVLAGCSLALCSTVPFILRSPTVTEDTILGGYCFAMAGIWLAASAVAARGASLRRLALMSLCFGLAVGSRATLGLTALVLVPVYLALRSTHSTRSLLIALGLPIGCCFALLLAYNEARFGAPFQFGGSYQLAGYDPQTASFGELSYLPPGAWSYLFSPPRPALLFPFVHLGVTSVSYPFSLPKIYDSEITGGLVAMSPIMLFLLVLPWSWRRRASRQGSLGLLMLVLAGAGMATLLYISYEWLGSTERYEVDFASALLFGALAGWLTISARAHGVLRRALRIGGGALLVWGCLMGLAISFTGYGNYLAVNHTGTWTALENLGSPLSTALVETRGRPVVAEVATPHPLPSEDLRYVSFSSPVEQLWLSASDRADITIVSPHAQSTPMLFVAIPGIEAVQHQGIQIGGPATASTLSVRAPEGVRSTYRVPLKGTKFLVQLRLSRGINRVSLTPLAGSLKRPRGHPDSLPLVIVKLSLPAGE